MPLFTMILHPGRPTYSFVNVFIGDWGSSFTGPYWVNACLTHVFAGFFGVHGWPLPPSLTWTLLLGLYVLQWPTASRDRFASAPAKPACSAFRGRQGARCQRWHKDGHPAVLGGLQQMTAAATRSTKAP
jgi:hypothetical protein